MLQVVYLPDARDPIEKFIVISDFEKMLEYLKFNKIKFLSIPPIDDSYDILDCIITNNIDIKTIHIQSGDDLLGRIKLFFAFAKAYSDNNIKNDVIMKHEYLDAELEKILKKTKQNEV